MGLHIGYKCKCQQNLDQGMAAAVRGRVVEANHVLWVVLWWVQEDEALVDFRLVCR